MINYISEEQEQKERELYPENLRNLNREALYEESKNGIYREIVRKYGSDILDNEDMQLEKTFRQHGNVSVYEHSINVAVMALVIARHTDINIDEKSMIRGALLHDFFLYDWHDNDESHRLHGFTHAGEALRNAEKDFELNDIERNVIERHMFPLNVRPPKYMEAWIVCVADKICAAYETLPIPERFQVGELY